MEKLHYKQGNTNDVINKVPKVLKWLSNKGAVVKTSRYSRYKDYIDNFYKEKESLSILDKKFINDSLGVCFTTYKCLWLNNLTVNYFKNMRVEASSDISDDKYRLNKDSIILLEQIRILDKRRLKEKNCRHMCR